MRSFLSWLQFWRLSAQVTYVQPLPEVVKRSFDHVTDGLDTAVFEPTEPHWEVPTVPRVVQFKLLRLAPGKRTATGILFQIASYGMRPALYPEFLAFLAKYPNKQRRVGIIAFGSAAKVGRERKVAWAYRAHDERMNVIRTMYFGHYSDDIPLSWPDYMRFLAVPLECDKLS